MLDLSTSVKVTYIKPDGTEEKEKSLPSEKVKLSNDDKESLEENSNSLSIKKMYKSTGNINNLKTNYSEEFIKRPKFISKDNLLKYTLEKNGENVEIQSMSNLDEAKMKHSLSFLSLERNSRELNNGIRKLRKTLTNSYISENGSSDSLFSGYASSDSICSSAYSINDSSFSVCDSCDSICESVVDLLEKKETKKYTEVENGHLKLITYNQCPKWLADNPYIISKYRPPCYSYMSCYKSLFYIHNETGNVYTHLVGAVFFTVFYLCTVYLYVPELKKVEFLEKVSIVMSVIGGLTCMCFSWHFHLFSAHSLKVNRNWLTCDFIGIVSLIYTTGLPLSYYSFYCYPEFRAKYMAVSAIIGAVSFLSILNPIFSRDEYRLIRSTLFLFLSISELIPVGYGLIKYNRDILFNYLSFNWYAAGALLYLIGLILYAKRIPEIYYPGLFDLVGHSHQLFHSLILVASISFYVGIMKSANAFNSDPDVCTKLY
jgi:adiponectin receptor